MKLNRILNLWPPFSEGDYYVNRVFVIVEEEQAWLGGEVASDTFIGGEVDGESFTAGAVQTFHGANVGFQNAN